MKTKRILVIARELQIQCNIRLLWIGSIYPTIVTVLLLRLFPISAQAQFDYNIANDNTVTVTGYDCSNHAVTISNKINELPVVCIGGSAFLGCTELISVTIPNSVTSIGDNAFMGCGLTNVTIGSSVTSIGIGAFVNCKKLVSVTIPASITSIKHDAFRGCTSLTRVYFLGNAPSVGSHVFYGANNATVYFLSGSTGWNTIFCDRPTALWTVTPP